MRSCSFQHGPLSQIFCGPQLVCADTFSCYVCVSSQAEETILKVALKSKVCLCVCDQSIHNYDGDDNAMCTKTQTYSTDMIS